MKMLVFFLAKCVRNAVKTMVVDRKNQKALALLYLASKPLRKAANSSGVPTEFEQNRRGKFELFAWTLSPNFFRLDWTFPLPPKRQLSVLLNFFFPLTNLFLTFVVFACFATTRVNMRFRAENTRDSAQDSIQCRKCIGSPLVWTDGRTDTRTDGCTDGRSRDYCVTTKISRIDRLQEAGGSDELGPGHKRRYWRMKNRGVWPSWRHI